MRMAALLISFLRDLEAYGVGQKVLFRRGWGCPVDLPSSWRQSVALAVTGAGSVRHRGLSSKRSS